MTTDRPDLDARAAELFRAGRDERPSEAARRKTRAALHSAKPARRRAPYSALALAAAVVLAIAASLGLGERDSAPLLEAEPARPLPPPSASAPAEAPLPARSLAVPLPAPDFVRPPSPAPRPSQPPAPPSLGEEIEALDAVRRALTAGDATRALALLDKHRVRRLGDEATLLRIEALQRSGRASDAALLARRFVDDHPASPHLDRARAFTADAATTHEPGDGGTR
jgi:hypothetical protein